MRKKRKIIISSLSLSLLLLIGCIMGLFLNQHSKISVSDKSPIKISVLTPSNRPMLPFSDSTPTFSNAKIEIPFETELLRHLPIGTPWALSNITASNISQQTILVRGGPVIISVSAHLAAIVTIHNDKKDVTSQVSFDLSSQQYRIFNLTVFDIAPIDPLLPDTLPAAESFTPDATPVFTITKVSDQVYQALSTKLGTGPYSDVVINPLDRTTFNHITSPSGQGYATIKVSGSVTSNNINYHFSVIIQHNDSTNVYSYQQENTQIWTSTSTMDPTIHTFNPTTPVFTIDTVSKQVHQALTDTFNSNAYSNVIINPLDMKTFEYVDNSTYSSIQVTGTVTFNHIDNSFSVRIKHGLTNHTYSYENISIWTQASDSTSAAAESFVPDATPVFTMATVQNQVYQALSTKLGTGPYSNVVIDPLDMTTFDYVTNGTENYATIKVSGLVTSHNNNCQFIVIVQHNDLGNVYSYQKENISIWTKASDSTSAAAESFVPDAAPVFTIETVQNQVHQALSTKLGTGPYSNVVIDPLDMTTFDYVTNGTKNYATIKVSGLVRSHNNNCQFIVIVQHNDLGNVYSYQKENTEIWTQASDSTSAAAESFVPDATPVFTMATVQNQVHQALSTKLGTVPYSNVVINQLDMTTFNHVTSGKEHYATIKVSGSVKSNNINYQFSVIVQHNDSTNVYSYQQENTQIRTSSSTMDPTIHTFDPTTPVFTMATVSPQVNLALIKHLGVNKYSNVVITPLDYSTFHYDKDTNVSSIKVTGTVHYNGRVDNFNVNVTYNIGHKAYHHNNCLITTYNSWITPSVSVLNDNKINYLVKLIMAKFNRVNPDSITSCINHMNSKTGISRSGNVIWLNIKGWSQTTCHWSRHNSYDLKVSYDIGTHKYTIAGAIWPY